MAAVLGRWQGGIVSIVPPTTYAVPTSDLFNSGSAVRNDGSAYALSSSARLTLPSSALADGYLIVARVTYVDTSAGRVSMSGRIVQISGTGNFVPFTHGTYSRDGNNDYATLNTSAFIDNPSASATFDFQWQTGSDAPTGGTTRAVFEVIPFFYADIGMYTGAGLELLTGTTRNVTTLSATVVEGTNITRSANVVTVTGDNKRYMIISSNFSIARGTGNRTQRIFGLDYDGTADLAAQSYAYYRQPSADHCGGTIMDIIETVTASRTIESTTFRGIGVLNGEGGADTDGSVPTTTVNGLVVIELNDSAECFRTSDATGLQALDGTPPVDINAARTTGFIDAASWLKVGTVGMENNSGGTFDCITGANVWAASTDVTSTLRGSYQANITVDGTEDADLYNYAFIRGEQATSDTFGWAANPFGFRQLTDNQDLGVSVTQVGQLHPIDTQAGTVGFWGINLETMEASDPPTITDVETDEDIDDKQTAVTITGTIFEASQGTGKVEISDNATYGSGNVVAQTVTSWADTAIDITVVMGAMSPGLIRYVWVTNDTGDRNTTGFQVRLRRAQAFRMIASGNIAASGENTTQRLATPSGKVGGDFDGGRIQDDENPTDTINPTVDGFVEHEWCIEATADSNAVQYQFRTLVGGVVPGTLSVDPRWTVSVAGGLSIPVAMANYRRHHQNIRS